MKSKTCALRYCSKIKGAGQSHITKRAVSSFEMASGFARALYGRTRVAHSPGPMKSRTSTFQCASRNKGTG